MDPIFKMKGRQDTLEVFEDHLTITPKGVLGLLNKGVKGTKSIPFLSISAIQFKKSGLLNGYLQFTLAGGNESRSGILDATKDENTFMFSRHNDQAEKIKDYIEQRMREMRSSSHREQMDNSAPVISLGEELTKLAKLRDDGILSEEEFQAAKSRLLK
jgi:hypothetical protein